LSEGFPDFAAPEENQGIRAQSHLRYINQYAITWGAKRCATPCLKNLQRTQVFNYDPEREITICCGSTRSDDVRHMAIINPGYEVVVSIRSMKYRDPDAILSVVPPAALRQAVATPDGTSPKKELAAAFGPQTKAIILTRE